MRLEIRNVRGIVDDALDFRRGGMLVVPRLNAQGKTTIAACLSACLTRRPDPLGLAPRMGLYVHRGAASDESFAGLRDDGEGWMIVWRAGAGEFVTQGPAPVVPEAVLRFGQPLMGGKKQDAARRWLDALLPDPVTFEELRDELKEAVDEVNAARVAKMALDGDDGFARAHAVAEQQDKDVKAKWADVASAADGEKMNYGSRIATKWRPKGWIVELEGRGLSEIQQRLHDAREARRILADEVSALDSRVREADKAKARNDERQVHIAGLRRELQQAEALLGEKPERDSDLVLAQQTARQKVADCDDAVRAAKRSYADLADKARENSRTMSRRSERLAGLEQTVQLETRNIADYDESIGNLDKASENVGVATNCDSCGQMLPNAKIEEAREQGRATIAAKRAEAVRKRGLAEDRKRTAEAEIADINSKPPELHPTGSEEDAQAAIDRAQAELDAADKTRADMDRRANENLQRIQAHSETDGRVQNLRGRIQEAEAQSDVEVPEIPTESEREQARRNLHRAEDAVKAEESAEKVRKFFDDATAAQDEAVAWGRVRSILSPHDGIQARRQQERAAELAAAVEQVSKSILGAGAWLPDVTIDPQGPKFTVGGLPVEAASQSEQWWLFTICRLGLAVAAKSPVAIVDGADVLALAVREAYRLAVANIAREKNIAILWTETASS